jgi:hypothetical protein
MARNALREIQENRDEMTRPADQPSPQKKKVDGPSADTAQGQTFHRTLTVDGVQRTYDIYVPNSVAEKLRTEGLDNVNTIMGFHGTGGRSDRTVGGNLNLAEVANKTGSILIAPQALGQNDPSAPDDPNKNPSHWHVEGQSQKGPPVDDAAFLKAIQTDAEGALQKKYGRGQSREEFGKIDEVTPIGMSNGSVIAADIASNPKTYLREGTTIKGGAFVTATQEVELHEGNTPNTSSGEQLFVSGLQDSEALGNAFRGSSENEARWLSSADLSEREKRQYDQLKNPDDKAEFALQHQGQPDPKTGRTVTQDLIYEESRQRIVSAAAAQGVTVSDQAFDDAMKKTEWGHSGHLQMASEDGLHRINLRVDMVDKMEHEWSNDPKEVRRTGYNVNDRIAGSMNGTLDPKPEAPEAEVGKQMRADLDQDRARRAAPQFGPSGPS